MQAPQILPALAGAFLSLAALAPGAAAQTGSAGGGAPISNYQPSLVLTQGFATQGLFPCRACDGASAINTLGMVHTFAGSYDAFGMPKAQGQLVTIGSNTALFSIVENHFGGNGKSTFALPDLTGRVAVGLGGAYDLGAQAGSTSNVMTLGQLPSHDHGLPGGGMTGLAGGADPINNVQPSLGLNYQIAYHGFAGGTGGDPFVGEVSLFAGGFDPGGFMQADGRLLSKADYAELYGVIGNTYGGDATTFALPDLRGRVAVGVGNGVGLGDMFGDDSLVLTEANLPVHVHSLPGGGFTDPDGAGSAFDNAQASLGLNYLISLGGLFPGRDGGGSAPDFQYYGEVVAYAGSVAPAGWAFANGQLLTITSNTALFSILGTVYGGNGVSTFGLPDLRGRVVVGSGVGFNVGDLLGERFATLSEDQMAAHVHSLPDTMAGGAPEPASWALMIAGFGLSGMALRRRRVAAI